MNIVGNFGRVIFGLVVFLGLVFYFGENVFSAGGDNLLLRETFERDALGWESERAVRVFAAGNVLRINPNKDSLTEAEPVISKAYNLVGSQLRVIIDVRTLTASELVINWTTKESPTRDDIKRLAHKLNTDGEYHKVGFFLPVSDMLETLSLKFTSVSGMWEIRSIEFYGQRTEPISLRKVSQFRQKNTDGTEREMLRYSVRNDAPFALNFNVEQPDGVDDLSVKLSRNQTIDFGVPVKPSGNLSAVRLVLRSSDSGVSDWFPEAIFPVFLYDPKPDADWITSKLGQYIFELSPDARIARVKRGGEVVAIIAPIVHCGGVIPDFKQKKAAEIINASDNRRVARNNISAAITTAEVIEDKLSFGFTSDVVDLDIVIINETIKFSIKNKRDAGNNIAGGKLFEGPVVRVFGKLRSGLLPGVEFLGAGDVSSSQIDINPPYNYRGKPNPTWVTMPMAVIGTEKISAMLSWRDTGLQPTFHVPNTIDYTDDNRMSLSGKSIDAELRIFAESKESAAVEGLRTYIKERGLPNPSAAPRSSAEQSKLCLEGFRNSIQSPDGTSWGYAADPAWQRRPYADVLSTIARLTGRVPLIKSIDAGGADIANDAIYFLTGNVDQWKTVREDSIRSILALRNPDGSYLFRSRFPEVENAATSHGITAVRCLEIMEYIRLTGDEKLFESVAESLELLAQCNVPRGGFYQDSPLHTPDLLTAAELTWLFTWAYEYSGERRYIGLANRFAICGLPFIYQWTNRETMMYAAIPKLGGNSRNTPLWFGVAQQKTGIIYAYALTQLAKHDNSINWTTVATGILHAAEKMQFTNGNNIGCVPDKFEIESQYGSDLGINPSAVATLRLTIEGKPSTLFVLTDHGNRYASPFPLKSTKRGIEATNVPPNQPFQILTNGNKIINARGNGIVMVD